MSHFKADCSKDNFDIIIPLSFHFELSFYQLARAMAFSVLELPFVAFYTSRVT